jgi:hypothetical protein
VYEEITEPRQIRLKGKYRSAQKGRYSGGPNAAPPKNRHKLSDVMKRNLPPQPKIVLHVFASGKARFERVG